MSRVWYNTGMGREVTFIHTSDIHLGRSFKYLGDKAKSARDHLNDILFKIADLAITKKVDIVFIVGDLFDKDNIYVSVTNDVLTIKAEKREEQDEKRKYYKREMRSIESIARSVTLPSSVKSDSVNATLKNGVLKLVFTKKEESKPKTIKITEEK